jgi:hypothetical protein
MIDVEELRKWRNAEPFRAFEIVLEDGRTALIKHPWNVGWSAERRFVMFAWGRDDVDSADFARVREIRAAKKGGARRSRSTKRRGRS